MPPSAPKPGVAVQAPAVRLQTVSRVYGSFVALREVSLTVPAGSSVVLLGPNGAGKSTLLKVLAGLVRATRGSVKVLGEDPAAPALRGQVAYMGHHTMLYDELTGPENLEYMLPLQRPELRPAERSSQVTKALQAVGLDPANKRRLAEYSQGMRQRASLARVLLGNPALLLLDEPFSNLDPASAHAMVVRLQQWLAEPVSGEARRTLLLTTHQVHLAEPLARTRLMLQGGRLVEPSTLDAGGAAAQQPQAIL